MPNLHDLLDEVCDDLPPLPNLAPSARRIVRRKKLAARSAGAMLSGVLVAGAATFLFGGAPATTPSDTGAGSGSSSAEPVIAPATSFHEEAVSALEQIWPVAGEQIKFVGKPDQTIYAAFTPTASYRVVLAFYLLPANDPQNQPHVPCADNTGPQSQFTCGELPNGHTVAARVGEGMAEFDFTVDNVYATLNVVGGPMTRLDAHALLTMAKSAVFQQLTADAHQYKGVITPMPGTNVGSAKPGVTPHITATRPNGG